MDSKQLIKILCAYECINYEKAAEIIAQKMNKHFTKASLNGRVSKDTLRFSEAYTLADALGYDLVPVKRKK